MMANELTKGQVFLSYSREDAQIMIRVREELEKLGVHVWTDETLTPGTESWKSSIEQAIQQSLGIVVILSPSARESIWVEREVDFARVHGLRIFPLLVRGEPNNAIPIELINAQWIDLREESNFQRQLKILEATIHNKPTILPDRIPSTTPLLKSKTKISRPIMVVVVSLFSVIILTMILGPKIFKSVGINQPTKTSQLVLVQSTPSTIEPVSVMVSTSTERPTTITPSNTPPPPTLTPSLTLPPSTATPQWSGILAVRMPTLNEIREDMLSIWDANLLTVDDILTPGTQNYQGTAKYGKEYLWPFRWCTLNKTILDENLENLTVNFLVNDERVPEDDVFYYHYDNNTGWSCGFWAIVIGGWTRQTGIELRTTYTIENEINDGQLKYPPGEYSHLLNITVP